MGWEILEVVFVYFVVVVEVDGQLALLLVVQGDLQEIDLLFDYLGK